jgi:SAM-dependent methyltransferase
VWNNGYMSEIDYIYGYYSELAPIRLKLALLSRGVAHSVGSAPNYLELGFGQGLSLGINAATNSGQFYGTDFNPGQAANAKELADAIGKQMWLFDNSFEELAARTDLPDFDIIALHGIWSWISEKSRDAILKIAQDKLKPGGIFYISYNVTPGWSPAVPLRHLLSEYSNRAATGGILGKVDQSINFVEQVINAGAAYFNAHPQLAQRLQQIKSLNRTYVTHEYFNANWDPMPFSVVADRLAEAKLTFGCSANVLDNLEAISVPVGAHPILAEISDPVLRETTKDYFVSQQFRRDIFVKGPRAISNYEMAKLVDEQVFIALGSEDACPNKIATSAGEAELRPGIYTPLAKALCSAPNSTASIGELMKNVGLKGLERAQIWEGMLVLTAAGFAAPAADSSAPAEDLKASQSLNRLICEKAEASEQMQFLAAPKLGAAISVNRIDQLFMRGEALGEKNLPAFVWRILSAQGQRLVVEEKAVEAEEENLIELKKLYSAFKSGRKARLKALGVI